VAGNTMAIEFAGDAQKLQRAARQAQESVGAVGSSATTASDDMRRAADSSDQLTGRFGDLGAATSGTLDGLDALGGGLQAVVDIQEYAKDKAAEHAQALVDVEQAQRDLNQAYLDGKQATRDVAQAEIDVKQAQLDAKTAAEEYAAAVKEHGANSTEAQQASIDLAQAQEDLKQANLDAEQATADAAQATTDAKQAQLDMNEATRAANPPELQKWADGLALVTPLLSAVAGVVGVVTAVQWAWNAAMLANPITWIVLAIVALIAIVVLLVKNWDTVKKAGSAAWNWIKDAASSAWNFIKKIPGWIGTAFKNIARVISAPYRAAFNLISDAWNNTIGRLSWTVPGWIPGIGGNTIAVPQLPRFHDGGRVPGPPGSEMLAILEGGETVRPAGAGDSITVIVKLDSDVLVEGMAKGVGRRGGNTQFVLGVPGAR
jgi:hypothetical protein